MDLGFTSREPSEPWQREETLEGCIKRTRACNKSSVAASLARNLADMVFDIDSSNQWSTLSTSQPATTIQPRVPQCTRPDHYSFASCQGLVKASCPWSTMTLPSVTLAKTAQTLASASPRWLWSARTTTRRMLNQTQRLSPRSRMWGPEPGGAEEDVPEEKRDVEMEEDARRAPPKVQPHPAAAKSTLRMTSVRKMKMNGRSARLARGTSLAVISMAARPIVKSAPSTSVV